jgi:hypothetical protein
LPPVGEVASEYCLDADQKANIQELVRTPGIDAASVIDAADKAMHARKKERRR